MKLQGEAVYLGSKYSDPSEQFPEGSFMVTLADEEGGTITAWARGDVLNKDELPKQLTPVSVEINVRRREAFGDKPSGWSVTMLSMTAKAAGR